MSGQFRLPSLFGRALPAPLKADFEAFWKAYPPRRPNPRVQAEVAFVAACRRATPAQLVAAAGAFAAECVARKIDPAYVPHAATWLRQDRWADYLAAPAPAAEAAEPEGPLWQRLRGRIGADDYRVWIAKLAIHDWVEGDRILLRAPSTFHRDYVRSNFLALLRAGLGVNTVGILGPRDPG